MHYPYLYIYNYTFVMTSKFTMAFNSEIKDKQTEGYS